MCLSLMIGMDFEDFHDKDCSIGLEGCEGCQAIVVQLGQVKIEKAKGSRNFGRTPKNPVVIKHGLLDDVLSQKPPFLEDVPAMFDDTGGYTPEDSTTQVRKESL